MTKDDFKKKWNEILENDCKKTNTSSLSRTLTDTEAAKICDHLWELLEASIPTQERLTHALLKTQGKYDSQWDRADAILKQL